MKKCLEIVKGSKEMLFVGICDDSLVASDELAQMILEYCKKKNVEVKFIFFSSGEEVIEFCDSNKNEAETIDILFLDIEMTGMSGLDCKNMILHKECVWRICFYTSHSGAVYDAFSTKTIGYLVKPLEMIKVYQILDIVLNEKNERKSISYVEIDGCKKEVYLDDIAYIQAEGSYARLRLNNDVGDVIIVSKKLGQIEKELQGTDFVRCHKSYLINMSNIKSVGQQVIMINTDEIPIGRAYRNGFASRYRIFIKQMIQKRI